MASRITEKDFEEWLHGAFIGDPEQAREFCQRTMSPNYLRFSAGGGRTDFEGAVAKVARFRSLDMKVLVKVEFLVQEENNLAVRCAITMTTGQEPEKQMELMFMADRDDEGRYQNVRELAQDIDTK